MGFTSELEELHPGIFHRIAAFSRAQAIIVAQPVIADGGALQLELADKRLSDDFAEALSFIKSSIGKMDRLISAILSLTREGRREFSPVPVEMRELINGIVSTLAHSAAEAEAKIEIGNVPNVISDRLALE